MAWPTTTPWSSWAEWRHLNCATDQGPHCVASYWWVQHLGLNLTRWWDFSHSCQNDHKSLVRDSGMWPFWLLMLVAWSAPCGPLQDRTQWQQREESWREVFENMSAKNCPLFQERVDRIIMDLGGLGLLPSDPGRDTDEVLWDFIRDRPPFCAGQQKCNLNRFFSSTARAREELGRWHCALINYEIVALEEGMVSSKNLPKIALRPERPQNDEAARASAGAPRPIIQDDDMKGAQNAVVVVVSMLGEPTTSTSGYCLGAPPRSKFGCGIRAKSYARRTTPRSGSLANWRRTSWAT